MTQLKGIALAAATGSVGGGVFALAGLPAGWLTGSMVAAAALVIAGAPLSMPDWVRQIIFVLLGVSMGSAFTPETVATMFKWPASLMGLAFAVAGVMAACTAFLLLCAKWDRPTSFFAAVPGAMSYVLALSLQSPADTRLVVVAQMLRLLILMALLPIFVRATMPFQPMPAAADMTALATAIGFGAEIALGFALGYALERLNVPAGLMVGGMVAGGAVHMSGLVGGDMPAAILIPSQILLGAFIGLRFTGTDLKLLRQALLPGFGSFVIAIAVSGAAAIAVARGLDLPLGQVLVAFAPGGLEAMTILAFVLGLDPAYVGMHQLARFLGLSLILPLVAKIYLK